MILAIPQDMPEQNNTGGSKLSLFTPHSTHALGSKHFTMSLRYTFANLLVLCLEDALHRLGQSSYIAFFAIV